MIREMTRADFEIFWPTFQAIIQAQETYPYPPSLTFEQAYQLWCEQPQKTLVVEESGQILGSYMIQPDAMGPGDHICNCSYICQSAEGARIATLMCEHSMEMARELGYIAMLFRSVVSTNEVAIQLWQTLGFRIVGTIPKGYRHGRLGLVDSYIMFKSL
ncbi:N-acetyltransferase family protein [Celerinatantimonas sp. YJH-8]|uniref:GNAT family N-acetyltransferase n=1 Tax=Celerinatantimonas sp. YJH-8 TaxID=3228714 RepID=UPI0038C1EF30